MNKGELRERIKQTNNFESSLDEYIKVASPRLWIMIVFLVGCLLSFVVWLLVGNVNKEVYSLAIVDNGVANVYIYFDDMNSLESYRDGNADKQKIVIDNREYLITDEMIVNRKIANLKEELNKSTKEIVSLGNDPVYLLSFDTNLDDGIFDAKIVIYTKHPIDYLLN